MIIFAAPIEQHPPHLKFTTVPVMTNPVAAFPASNLVEYDHTRVAKSSTGSTVISWAFGKLRRFDLVSIIGASVKARATIKIDGSIDNVNWDVLQATRPFWAHLTTVPAAAPDTFAEDLDPRAGSLERNHSFFYSPATVFNYSFLRITITDPDSTSLSFGRLFVGRTFRPKVSYQYGSSFKFEDTGSKDRTDQGAQILMPGKTIVSATVKLEFLSTNEMYDYVWEFNYWRQSTREMFCCLDVNTTATSLDRLQKNILYCTLSEGRQIVADSFEAWSQSWTLESI